MPGEQGVHVVAHAIAEIVADGAYSIEPGDQDIAIERGKLANDLEGLVRTLVKLAAVLQVKPSSVIQRMEKYT